MANEENIVRFTRTELKEMNARGEVLTDWARFDAMTDEELEASIDWDDEGQFEWGPAYRGTAAIRQPTTARFDGTIVTWFKGRGSHHRTRMETVLRNYVDAQLLALDSELPFHHRRAG